MLNDMTPLFMRSGGAAIAKHLSFAAFVGSSLLPLKGGDPASTDVDWKKDRAPTQPSKEETGIKIVWNNTIANLSYPSMSH